MFKRNFEGTFVEVNVEELCKEKIVGESDRTLCGGTSTTRLGDQGGRLTERRLETLSENNRLS